MQAQVSKWGHSLALRLPRAFADELGGKGASVELRLEAGKVIIEPTPKRRYKLEDLLSKVTTKNRHEAVEDGPTVGDEAW